MQIRLRCIVSAAALVALAYVWTVCEVWDLGPLRGHPAIFRIDTYTPVAVGVLTTVSILLILLSIRGSADPLGVRLAFLTASINLGTAAWLCARAGYHSASTVLWILCILIAIGLANRIRTSAGDIPSHDLVCSTLSQSNRPNISRTEWLCIVSVIIISVIGYTWRLTEIPQFVRSYGMHGFINALRLRTGLIPLEDLVLYREMTQEDCGASLLFVLWHALFQLLPGGMTLFNARLACASAVIVSLFFMFRIGRRLGGATFGLICLVAYAGLPSTFFNARHEGIFGFSALLFLFCTDIALGFAAHPSRARAVLLGIAIPCLGYGLANVKLMSMALLATVGLALAQQSSFRKYSRHLLITVGTSALLCAPQFANWSAVKANLIGRGEHLFGRNFRHMIASDPLQRGYWYHVLEALTNNISAILGTFFRPALDTATTHIGLLSIFVLLGLIFSLSRPLRIPYFFILSLTVSTYAALLVAVPASTERMMLLGIPQAFLIAVFWSHLYSSLATKFHRTTAITITILLLLSATCPGLAYAFRELGTQTQAGALRTRIAPQSQHGIIFYAHDEETSLNTLRLNHPTFGPDSASDIPIIGMPANGSHAFIALTEELELPAVIINRRPDPGLTNPLPGWHYEELQAALWERWYMLWHTPQSPSKRITVRSLLPFSFMYKGRALHTRGSYRSITLRERNIPAESIDVPFELDSTYHNAAISVQDSTSYSPPIEIRIDGNHILSRSIRDGEPGKEVVWLLVGDLSPGKHTLTLTRRNPEKDAWVSEVILIGSSGPATLALGSP
jgi:hypothetical protein